MPAAAISSHLGVDSSESSQRQTPSCVSALVMQTVGSQVTNMSQRRNGFLCTCPGAVEAKPWEVDNDSTSED
jgi:hypothetical protein